DGTVVTLLHTNDMHGHAYLPGKAQGLARLGTFIDEVRAQMPNVLLIDAGDIIHGTPEEKEFKGLPLLSAMNALKYDVAAAGNHEFDFGQKVTRAAFDYARFPVLSANVVDEKTGKPWGGLEPYKVFTRGGVRVGIFGLTTLLTVGIQWPKTLAGIGFNEPMEAARRMVAHLRGSERADVVIALSHLGYGEDRKLAGEVSGIDVILGAHSHTRLDEQVWINGTLITQTGAHGRALCRVDLVVRPAASPSSGPGRVLAINGRGGVWWGSGGAVAPLGKRYPNAPLLVPTLETPEHAGVVRAFAPYHQKMQEKLGEKLTEALEPLPGADATTRETPLGNLLAEAVLRHSRADVAFFSSGQFAARGLDAGPVTVGEMYALMGSYTRQHVVTVRAEGGALKAAFATIYGDPAKYPAHVAGAARSADAVDPAKTYTVAAAAHVIQDYLLGKPGVTVLSDDVSAPTVRDAAIAHLRGHAPLRNA
ncbi:MAG TPA: metallophosphoesterase, partial [Armatimonadaceae bacterium]|nr:metallophosphoesterase [Armatimonadaceae bacterium]